MVVSIICLIVSALVIWVATLCGLSRPKDLLEDGWWEVGVIAFVGMSFAAHAEELGLGTILCAHLSAILLAIACRKRFQAAVMTEKVVNRADELGLIESRDKNLAWRNLFAFLTAK